MPDLRQLYDLQTLDLEVDARKEALGRVESSLSEPSELEGAREAWTASAKELAEAERGQRDLELELQSLRSKHTQEEAKLYGGSVKNSRELAGLQAEVTSLATMVRELEDKLLEIMSSLEELRRRESEQRAVLKDKEDQWTEEKGTLLKEQEALQSVLMSLSEQRSAAARTIEGSLLALYERLRQGRQGKGVARVEGGTCGGCRVHLPLNDIQRSRSGRDLVRCSNCGRILYVV